MGLRYRVQYPVLGDRRRVDIAFPAARIAVDVRGCFWHACVEHGTVPHNNREWWMQKLARNVERDDRTGAQLEAAGWALIVVWEHEAPEDAAARVVAAVRGRRTLR